MYLFNHLRSSTIFVIMLLSSILTLPLSLQARPPIPPAQLFLPEDKTLIEIKLEDGYLIIPVHVQVNTKLKDLSIMVRLIRDELLKEQEITKKRYEVKAYEKGDTTRVRVTIPSQKRLGKYKINFELEGILDDRKGILDRKVIYLMVNQEEQKLIRPVDLRRKQTQKLKMEFQKTLKEYPNMPDIRLLSENTIQVPEKIIKEIVPYKRKLQLEMRGVGPSNDLKPYIIDRTTDNWDKRDPITVRGRIVYNDFEGTWRPLVNVSVNLYDDDTFWDDHLGTTATDWNGNWSFTVNNNDGWFQNGRDIYYKFHLGNTRWHVRDSDGDEYRWKSATHNDLSDGSIVDFGTETGSTNEEAMQIFAMINRGWNHIVTVGGQDPGHVEVRFPESSTAWYHGSERIKIEMGYSDGPDVVLHEYGHALMHYAFGGTNISPGGSHSFNDITQDKGLAYSEGWATGFMLSVCPDGMFNWHEGTTEGTGEYPNCNTQNDAGRNIENFSSSNRVGEETEGRVAAAINDFLDSPNDDNGGILNRGRNNLGDQNSANRISLSTIYRDVMWGYVHNDFLKFWIMLEGELSGNRLTMAQDIMRYNCMSLPLDVSCAASKIAVTKRKDYQNLLNGLRSFRDHALKPLCLGRYWMETYYRHSPEIAMLLIRDKETRNATTMIIEHFSSIGQLITNQDSMSILIIKNQKFIPSEISMAFSTVMKSIEERGSKELKQELIELRSLVSSLEELTIAEVMVEVNRIKKYEQGRLTKAVQPSKLSPTSKKADWELIRDSLPESIKSQKELEKR